MLKLKMLYVTECDISYSCQKLDSNKKYYKVDIK